MHTSSFKERLRYAFDNTMSKGTGALIAWLGIISLVLILAISFIVWVAQLAPDIGFVQLAWMSLLRTLDSGTMGGDQGGWPFLIAMLAVTFGGIFIISTLIGVLTSGIESKIESLRKGRSKVIEENHTAILGWSDQIFTIISELVAANANKSKSCIVIMGDKDKVEMEDEIKDHVGSTGKTRIVCRQGSPIDLTALEIVNLNVARSIILLSPESPEPDSSVIKAMLAITNSPNRKAEPYHIVAEVRDPKNLEVAKLVGKDEVEIVLVGDLIARIVAQTCRQSGLSIVYTELMDFGGDEIYVQEEPALVGKKFGEIISMYEDSCIIGTCPKGSVPKLNPSMDSVIQAGDKIIAISEDDDTVKISGMTDHGVRTDVIVEGQKASLQPEKTLILGWNWRGAAILNELDNYVASGSMVTVAASTPEAEEAIQKNCPQKNQKAQFMQADTTDRRTLDKILETNFDHIILLCYSDTLEMQEADARTLITLLHLRDIAERAGKKFSVVSEMLDIKNRNLAEVAKVNDFIVSDKLISLLLAQISENKMLNAVFGDLFDADGSEIYLKPATHYVRTGEQVNFYTVVEAARRRGEVAIGYKIASLANDADKAYGVVVNPEKSNTLSFASDDKLIVIAED